MLLAASSGISCLGCGVSSLSHRELILSIQVWSTCVWRPGSHEGTGTCDTECNTSCGQISIKGRCKLLGGSAIRDGKHYKYSYIVILLSQKFIWHDPFGGRPVIRNRGTPYRDSVPLWVQWTFYCITPAMPRLSGAFKGSIPL